MKKEYQKHIVSTPEHQVWLHRTSKNVIDQILKEGLRFGSGNLSSTASLQSINLKEAEHSYRETHKDNNAVIVIKIPQLIASEYYRPRHGEKGIGHEGYEQDRRVTYFWEGAYHIQRQHVHGWIDKDTNNYHPNPYRDEPQQLTNKHFPPSGYGGLERNLGMLTPKPDRTKKTKSPNSRVKQLPPPPSEIRI